LSAVVGSGPFAWESAPLEPWTGTDLAGGPYAGTARQADRFGGCNCDSFPSNVWRLASDAFSEAFMSLTTMRRKFKRAEKPIQWLLLVIFVLGCFTLYGSYNLSGHPAQAEDLVVAKVNGEEIPRDMYDRMLAANQQRMQMSNANGPVGPEQEIQMKAAAFEMALNNSLQVQLAKQQGVGVSDSDARAMQKKLVDQVLAGKLTGMSEEDKRVEQDQIRERMFPLDLVKNQLMTDGLQKKLQAETKPTEADLMKSYQEFKTRHILIKADTRPDAKAQSLAQNVLKEVKSGVGFDDLARKYSEDDGSKAKGGDLGWVSQKTGFVPEFKEALLKLNKGEVSPLVKSQFGYHIIKVDDVRSTLPKDINKPGKKAEYLKQLTDQMSADKFRDMMGKARTSAKIEPVDPFVKGYLTESEMLEAVQKNNQPQANQKRTEAIAAYEQAAHGRYGGPAVYTKLAELYQQNKQDDKAIDALQQAVAGRRNAELAWQLGELLMKAKKDQQAIKAYQVAADVAYDMPWLHPQLAARFRTLKRPDLAKQEDAKWQKWQAEHAKGGGAPININGQQMNLIHESTTLTPKQLEKMKKEGGLTATIPVKPVKK
jgi:parvulin-like peptidyl-prolyl isomerase